MIGGEIAQHIGFAWLMVFIGLTNLLYAIFLYSFVLGLFYISVNMNEQLFHLLPLRTLHNFNQIFFHVFTQNQSAAVSNNIILNVWPLTGTNSAVGGDYKRFYNTMDIP